MELKPKTHDSPPSGPDEHSLWFRGHVSYGRAHDGKRTPGCLRFIMALWQSWIQATPENGIYESRQFSIGFDVEPCAHLAIKQICLQVRVMASQGPSAGIVMLSNLVKVKF